MVTLFDFIWVYVKSMIFIIAVIFICGNYALENPYIAILGPIIGFAPLYVKLYRQQIQAKQKEKLDVLKRQYEEQKRIELEKEERRQAKLRERALSEMRSEMLFRKMNMFQLLMELRKRIARIESQEDGR
ncbi:MAG: hypothetical protein BWY32_01654 [bacterium ADurb.Bin243]|nr:MAG: hypothetical protein BWY32_01654 [bacterium ADurb.Bin243]